MLQDPVPSDPTSAASRLSIRSLRSTIGGPYDLEVDASECACVLGPSGSGKSVFLRLVADLDPGVGAVVLDGRDRASFRGPEWRSRVVYQSAEPAWWTDTVRTHLAADFDPHPLASALGLDDALLDRPVSLLSTGERQRMALLRSLALEPAVLLLDEPTASLDAESTQRLEACVRERRHVARLAVVWVTHSSEQAERIGGARYRMQDRGLHRL